MPPSEQDIRNRLLVVRLPALPHILLKLMEYCRAEQVGMAELAELISKDPAIAAKILGVANSSAYHRSGQKARLDQSLMSLGTDMIRTLVISESVFQTFSGFATANNINLCKFWLHSLTAAVLARDIARKIGYTNIDEAYLAGLLHDVGRLAFLVISPNEYAQYFRAEDDSDLCIKEEQTMRMTHPEAGAWLMERWKLDPQLADSVLYHHEPVSRIATAHPLVHIIYLAHALSCHPCDDPSVLEVAKLCGLKAEELSAIQNDAEKKVQDSADFLGIDLSAADDSTADSSHVQPSAVQKKLNDELHHVVQASETERNFARQTSEPALLKTISRSAHILFHIDDAIIMMLDTTSQMLVINPNGEYHQRLSGFSLPVRFGGTIADAISQKSLAFIMSSDRPAAEEPLMQALGAEALVCVPLTSGGQCLGVLLGRISPKKIAGLRASSGFVQVFATQTSSALLTLRQKQEELRNITANAIDEFRMTSRKVAHEVNNPLSIIKNYLNILNDKLQKQEPVVGEISILNEEIDRVGRIVTQFADPQSVIHKTTTDLNRILAEVSRLLRNSGFVPASVSMHTAFDEQAAETDCDDGKLRQILLNLIKNSIESMPNGGEITIANRGHVNQNGRLFIELSIRDTGTGIPKEILERLFSPVTSTKGGTHQGLGLSIVQDLIRELNGFISCRSGNSGTSFEILLPVRDTDNDRVASPPPA